MFQLVFRYWLSWVADTYLEKILFTMISLGYSNCLVFCGIFGCIGQEVIDDFIQLVMIKIALVFGIHILKSKVQTSFSDQWGKCLCRMLQEGGQVSVRNLQFLRSNCKC